MKDIAASVRARLANKARQDHRPFQELLEHYGLERFLHRLAESAHRGRFVLKGALMLRVWAAPLTRPTRDIDLLGFVSNELDELASIVREVCVCPVEDDGLVFDPNSVRAARIKEDADYAGVRVTFAGSLARARIPMQIDVGFGDVVHPGVEEQVYPTLLELPAPRLRMYPRETVVAEKYQAMVYLGSLNSRMKDFFDVWLLSRHFDFDGATLSVAIAKTFEHRGTELRADPICLGAEFLASTNAQKQWQAFVRRLGGGESVPARLDDLREPLRAFLMPITDGVRERGRFAGTWVASGPWVAA